MGYLRADLLSIGVMRDSGKRGRGTLRIPGRRAILGDVSVSGTGGLL